MIKVLIVDDSIVWRKALKDILSSDREISVIDAAFNGKEALEKLKTITPDVITLDIEMPVMNGIETLERVVKKYPEIPIVMVSSLTDNGASSTVTSLAKGAFDFICKPDYSKIYDGKKFRDRINSIIKSAYEAKISGHIKREAIKREKEKQKKIIISETKAVCIGTSTGGPRALDSVIPFLPGELTVPVFVVQHMPANFTKALAKRLDKISDLHVKEAEDKEKVKGGVVYIAPGGKQMHIIRKNAFSETININDTPENVPFKPCVDVMMSSAAEAFGKNTIGVIMTGMGSDGKRGMQKIKDYAGKTIAESEETCVIYGMPRAVIEAELADVVVPLHRIHQEIVNMVVEK